MRDRNSIYTDILNCCRQREQDALFYSDRESAKAAKAHMALIPALLNSDDPRRHRHYLEIDRPRLLLHCRGRSAPDLEPLWAELAGTFSATTDEKEMPESK